MVPLLTLCMQIKGSNLNITYTPNAGYFIDSIFVNNVFVGNRNKYLCQ